MRFFSFIQRQGQILRRFRVWLSRLFVWFTVKISLICLCTRPGFIWCFLPEFLEGKVRNLDAHFTVTVIYRQEDKAPWMLQTEDTSVCLHDLFWRQCRGGQKCMSRVRRSLWITFLRIKPHSAHGSASQAPGVRAIRNFLHTSGCAWLLCCLCSPTACALGMSRWEWGMLSLTSSSQTCSTFRRSSAAGAFVPQSSHIHCQRTGQIQGCGFVFWVGLQYQ